MEKNRLPQIELCADNQIQPITQLLESGAKIHIPKGMGKAGWTLLEQILPNIPAENVVLEDGVIMELLNSQGSFPESLKKLIQSEKAQSTGSIRDNFGHCRWLADQAEEAAQCGRVDYLEIMVESFGLHMPNVSSRYVDDVKTLQYMREHGAWVAGG